MTPEVSRPAAVGSQRRLRTPAPAEAGLPVSRCVNPIRCGGCGERMPEGHFVCRVGSMLVHNSKRCIGLQRDKAARAVAAEPEPAAEPEVRLCVPCSPVEQLTAPEAVPAGPVPRTGSDQRRAQMAASLSLNRRLAVRACLAGTCGVTGEAQMECLTCNARLHGVSCASITQGFASVGCFTCTIGVGWLGSPRTSPNRTPSPWFRA